MFAFVVFDLVF